jgi:hypothetical protein
MRGLHFVGLIIGEGGVEQSLFMELALKEYFEQFS